MNTQRIESFKNASRANLDKTTYEYSSVKFTVLPEENEVRDEIQDIIQNVRDNNDKTVAIAYAKRALEEIAKQEVISPLNLKERISQKEIMVELHAMEFFKKHGYTFIAQAEITL